jgi:hypothetical protein
MEEGTSKAIPLRRSRGARSVAPQMAAGWSGAITARLRAAIAPPRELWLAGLGGIALVVRGARGAWAQLVSEGLTAEAWLRRGRERAD